MIWRACFLWLFLCLPALAQDSPSVQARQALSQLENAHQQLQDARNARDRVAALTATIRAFEQGLSALRDGLRQVAIQERVLKEQLNQEEEALAALLGTLQTIGQSETPNLLLHPDGALGTARAGMLIAELGPALQLRAQEVRTDLERFQDLQSVQRAAAGRMSQGLAELQSARADLNQAMAARGPLPKRFSEDPTRRAILLASSDTLAEFARGLGNLIFNEVTPPLPLSASQPLGQWAAPVQGVVLRRAGEADAAGVKRPGVLLATRSGALVTSPSAATIRFTGDLFDLGQVVILEPKANTLMILAGMAVVYGNSGEVIVEGTPVGMMGGIQGSEEELISDQREGAGTARSETLYIEIRENDDTIDPAQWFSFASGS